MVQIEGSGKKPPAQHDVKLTPGILQQLISEMRRRGEFRNYRGRADKWGVGLMDAIVIPGVASIPKSEAPILAGLVGEWVTQWLINKHCGTNGKVDVRLLEKGDGGKDISANGLQIDVKTRTRDYGKFLVKKESLPPRCDAFAFCHYGCSLVASVHGWLWTGDVLNCEVEPALRGDHRNYVIPCDRLLPMSRLYDEIRSREIWR